MKAMILAAGRGERMRPLTDHTPKPLLYVGNQPLIAWHLQRLHQAGITEIVINHAWLGKQIEDTLGNGKKWGVHTHYSPEKDKGLETAGGIATALPLLGEEPFLVVNGDVLTDINFTQAYDIANQIAQQDTLAHIWLVNNPPHNPQGDFGLDGAGRVYATPNTGKAGTFSGTGVYSPRLFADTPAHKPAKLAPLLRQAMQQQQITGSWHAGLWIDVGTPERLQEANHWAKRHHI